MNKDMKEAFEADQAQGWVWEHERIMCTEYQVALQQGFQAAWEIQQKRVEELQTVLGIVNRTIENGDLILVGSVYHGVIQHALTKKEHNEN